jgi:hypothetical protein
VKARDPLVMFIVIMAATLLGAALIWVLAMPAEPAPWLAPNIGRCYP